MLAEDEVDCAPTKLFQNLELDELRTCMEEKIHKNGLQDSNRFYDMTHKKRGYIAIFNHDEFSEDLNLRHRPSSNRDFTRLARSFGEKFGFKVKEYFNFTYAEIMGQLKKYSKKDFTDHDCFMLVVLTHGKSGMLYAKDKDYDARSLWSEFTSAKCPTLNGKPRTFIIEACQGPKADGGTAIDIEITTSVKRNGKADSLDMANKVDFELEWKLFMSHLEPDFLVAFSSVPGYVSFSNDNGSWFIQELCKALENDNANDKMTHFQLLLTSVIQRIAFYYESNMQDNLEYHKKKQQPYFRSTLTKLLKFTPYER